MDNLDERKPFAYLLTEYILATMLRMTRDPLATPSEQEVRLYEEILERTKGL